MPTLASRSGASIVLRPYRLAEDEDLGWVDTYLAVLGPDGIKEFEVTLAATTEDFTDLGDNLVSVAQGKTRVCEWRSTDGDLVVVMSRSDSADDCSIGFWQGEPWGAMKGYRVGVDASVVLTFADELRHELGSVPVRGGLPK